LWTGAGRWTNGREAELHSGRLGLGLIKALFEQFLTTEYVSLPSQFSMIWVQGLNMLALHPSLHFSMAWKSLYIIVLISLKISTSSISSLS
jgi:hypothetical protein